MILDRELETPSLAQSTLVSTRKHLRRSTVLVNAGVFLLLLAVALVLQLASGAYGSEFNGYPDESAHYVTSLMVRQYITAPHPGAPVPFAQDYYAHYPKVAFGHWPPLLYVLQALWMMLFSSGRASVLVQLAFTTALLAYTVCAETRRWLRNLYPSFEMTAAVLAGLLFICIPLIQTYTAEEMSETLLTLMCFWSAIYFARYLDSERWQDNCWFGVFAALAILTKGSGWLLVLLPPLALLLTRRVRLLLRPSFWISALIVGASCIPWQLMTMHLVEEGWEGGSSPSVQYTLAALSQFFVLLVSILGTALFVLAFLGICRRVLLPMLKRPVASGPAVMFALIGADWLFHSLVPAGVEERKLIIAVPPLILFLVTGVLWLADRLPAPAPLRRWRAAFVALIACLFFGAQTFAVPHEKHYGYIEAARYIASHPALRKATVLVSSDSGGEGPFIAEVALCEPHPTAVILRATKVLAHVSFDADVYRGLFPDSASVSKYLYQRHVDLVVLDTFPQNFHFRHNQFLWDIVRQSPRFDLIAAFPDRSSPASGQVQLYRVKYPN